MAEKSSGMSIDRSLPNGGVAKMNLPNNMAGIVEQDPRAKQFYGVCIYVVVCLGDYYYL